MWRKNEPPGLIAIFGALAIVAACFILLHLLPGQLRTILLAWTLASFPIGMLISRCVLSEE